MESEKTLEYYQSLDKRTKEYKEWKARFEEKQAKKPEGLGDVVKSITKATGIDKLVKFVAGEDCGCEKRQAAWNKLFPFNKPKCLEENEYNFLADYFKVRIKSVQWEQIKRLYDIYNRVFGTNLEYSTCQSCLIKIVKKLEVIYKEYK